MFSELKDENPSNTVATSAFVVGGAVITAAKPATRVLSEVTEMCTLAPCLVGGLLEVELDALDEHSF